MRVGSEIRINGGGKFKILKKYNKYAYRLMSEDNEIINVFYSNIEKIELVKTDDSVNNISISSNHIHRMEIQSEIRNY